MTEYIVNPEEEHNLFYGRKYEELIRCMECKHFECYERGVMGFDGYDLIQRCTKHKCDADPLSFCSWAERETE